MRRSALALVPILSLIVVSTLPAAAQAPAVEQANALFEAEDWAGAAKAFGGLEDDAMRFVGVHVLTTGESRSFRMTFTPREDGSVRQFLEESTDGGKTFSTWFDGRYVPAGSEPAAAE